LLYTVILEVLGRQDARAIASVVGKEGADALWAGCDQAFGGRNYLTYVLLLATPSKSIRAAKLGLALSIYPILV